MALLIAPILFIGAVLYIAYPLLQEEWEKTSGDQPTDQEKVLSEKEEVIEALRDIDMDFRMGKLSPEDYQALKGDFEQRAVGVFERLESLQKKGHKSRKKTKS